MQLSNLALAYLLEELRPDLEGSIIRKVQEINPSGFKLKLQTRQGTKDLVLAFDAFFISTHTYPVNDKPGNFALRLKKFLLNQKLLSISQAGFERIVFFEFEKNILVLELFHSGNILLLDKEKTIMDVFSPQEFSERKLFRKEKYALPPSRGLDPSALEANTLAQKFSAEKKDAFHAFSSSVNIAPEIAEEVFFSQGIEKSAPVESLSLSDFEKIVKKTKELYDVKHGKLSPASLKGGYPFPIARLAGAPKQNLNINSFLDDYFSSKFEGELRTLSLGSQNKEKSKLEFERTRQTKAQEELLIAQSESAKKAELLYASYEEIQAILVLANELNKKKKTKEEALEAIKEVIGPQWSKKLISLDFKKKEISLEL